MGRCPFREAHAGGKALGQRNAIPDMTSYEQSWMISFSANNCIKKSFITKIILWDRSWPAVVSHHRGFARDSEQGRQFAFRQLERSGGVELGTIRGRSPSHHNGDGYVSIRCASGEETGRKEHSKEGAALLRGDEESKSVKRVSDLISSVAEEERSDRGILDRIQSSQRPFSQRADGEARQRVCRHGHDHRGE